ncbi:MAG: hypothetical protein Q8K63_12880 [Acidimicrobiales bacterium]|nr:hypothetical protein [Acidimicrobiales bacterium]
MTSNRFVRIGGTIVGGVVLVAGSLAGGVYVARIGNEASDQVVSLPDDPGVVHVHGLGINPAEGVLYAATHTGLFRIDAQGVARRVGDRFQDTMAFKVVGPDRFLASGHPDMRDAKLRVEGKPPLLGLIESVDRGSTWTERSLLGDADLHAIAARGDTIVAYDSSGGRVLGSIDGGRTWTPRSTIALRDLAVNPADANHVIAVTDDGELLESRDGAREWGALAASGPTAVTVLGWTSTRLWAGAEDGTLAGFEPSTATWETVRRFGGAVEAIGVDTDAIHVAVVDEGIYRADGGGAGWRRIYTPPDY